MSGVKRNARCRLPPWETVVMMLGAKRAVLVSPTNRCLYAKVCRVQLRNPAYEKMTELKRNARWTFPTNRCPYAKVCRVQLRNPAYDYFLLPAPCFLWFGTGHPHQGRAAFPTTGTHMPRHAAFPTPGSHMPRLAGFNYGTRPCILMEISCIL